MKRKMIYKIIPAVLLGMTLWAGSAPSLYAADGNTAVFDGKSISGNADLTSATVLPGSSASSSVTIETAASAEAANWYLSSGILESLEGYKDVAEGAGYAYTLSYESADTGKKAVLYSSEKIEGGTDDAGTDNLKAALAALGGNGGSGNAWFYLDTLKAGQTGVITLKVALDGETTANSYQLSKAQIYLRLAAETVSSTKPTTETKTKTEHKTIYETENVTVVQIDEEDVPLAEITPPKTGDETKLWLYIVLFGIGFFGLAVTFAARLRISDNEKRRRGA